MEPILNKTRLDAEAPDWRQLEVGYRRKPPVDFLARFVNLDFLEYVPKFLHFFGHSFVPLLKHNAPEFRTPGEDAAYFFGRLLVIGLGITALVTAVGRFGTLPYVASIAAGAGIVAAIRTLLIERGDWVKAASIAAAGFMLPNLIEWVNFMISFRPLAVTMSVGYMFWFALVIDFVCVHAYLWIASNPKIEIEARRLREEWIKRRFSPRKIQTFIRQTEQDLQAVGAGDSRRHQALRARLAELRALRGYGPTFITIFLLYAVLNHLPVSFYPSLLTLAVPSAFAFLMLRQGDAGKISITRHLMTFGRAIQSWLAKRKEIEDVPGLYRTVYGSAASRRTVMGLMIAAFCLFALPAARFFPIAYEVGQFASQDAWPKAFADFMGAGGLPKQDVLTAVLEETAPENLAAFMNTRPYGWFIVAAHASAHGQGWFLLAIAIGVLACFLFPLIFIFTLGTAIGSPLLVAGFAAAEAKDAPDQRPDVTDWECYVERLQKSKLPLEREHLWLGVHAEDDFPVLLHRDILSEHAYLVGDTGSGKTALGIIPLVSQLIRMNEAAVVIIDLKGDSALFQTAQAEARAAGRSFKWFTNEVGKSTYAFNPFQQKDANGISLNQFCETILEALHLNHGEGYGRSYFSRMARRWLSSNLKKRPNVGSFEELFKLTADERAAASPQERQDIMELVAVIESLASFEQLNMTIAGAKDRPEVVREAIYMPEVLEKKEIVYFWLPAAIEAATVRELAKLALYSLLTSAYSNQRRAGDENDPDAKKALAERRAFVVIDEFQRVASENFKIVLEQARSMGIGAILANQSLADLATKDTDLRPTVQTNTRFKLCFSATDPDQQQRIMTTSGERTKWRFSFSNPSESVFQPDKISVTGFSMSETVVPRVNRNDIIEVSDNPKLAVCHISRGSGYSQYSGYSFPMEMDFSITKEEYERRRRAPWPEPSAKTLIAKREPMQPEERASTVDSAAHEAPPPADTPEASAWVQRLKQGQLRLRDQA